jgi:hypothetical protein
MFVWQGPIQIVENRQKSPKIRASGRPPRVTHITTDRKIKLRQPGGGRAPGTPSSVSIFTAISDISKPF